MSEWEFAQSHPSEQLAKLHHFSVTKRQADGDVEFRILIKEYVCGENQMMRFYAEADKQTNQHTAPYTPCGWGGSLLKALSECIRAIHRFRYEGDASDHGSNRGQTGR